MNEERKKVYNVMICYKYIIVKGLPPSPHIVTFVCVCVREHMSSFDPVHRN